ncbi:glutamine amidotransferase [Klebsiella oxytoca]|uniref:Glutamine amidotransferase n=1 Tax=Klebsiella oxytoca TaxID=571 RepID=A0A6B8MT46_KLEOX|nr:glutamine amidotransferase [Klebsiella oxytoca]QGN38059.1 glutamine amidotransferase [Klebsiella oxytoca]
MSLSRNTLLIVQTGTPPDEIASDHGDLPVWFGDLLAPWRKKISVARVFAGEPLPAPDNDTVAVITGSWDMVTERLPWSEMTAAWIREAMAIEMPLFGVCYGHQLMAHALGGEVDYHPAGREVGSKSIALSADGLTDSLLAGHSAPFSAHLTHMQTVTRLPQGATVLGASQHDSHQIVRYGAHAVSTQFHPEITPTIARSLIAYRQAVLRSEGVDPDKLSREVEESPVASAILTRFVANYLTPDSL